MRRVVLIVNPYSTGVTRRRVAEVTAALARHAEVILRQTEAKGHAVQLAGEAAGEADAVVVLSGDGTYNEAINGAAGKLPFGFLPGGGASVFPRALGLPRDPVAAADRVGRALETGRTVSISLGRVNGRLFCFSAGIGFDAEAVRRVDELGRRDDGKRPGDLAFALAIVRALASHRGRLEPELEVKGYGRAALAFVANCTPYTYAKGLGLRIAPEADFELGLDLVAPIRVRRRRLVPTVVELMTGRVRDRGPYLYGHDLDRLEVVCDRPLPLHADGEDMGDVREAIFEAERSAVAVLV